MAKVFAHPAYRGFNPDYACGYFATEAEEIILIWSLLRGVSVAHDLLTQKFL